MKNAILDTCFWIAYFDKDDIFHTRSIEIYEGLMKSTYRGYVPFPTLYEYLNTKFLKQNPIARKDFFEIMARKNIDHIHDNEYRVKALENIHEHSLNRSSKKGGSRGISLVDFIIREILLDNNLKIDYLVTSNTSDFTDICRKRKIQMITN